jgi:MFS family permease
VCSQLRSRRAHLFGLAERSSAAGLATSLLFVKDTRAHVAAEQRGHGERAVQAPFWTSFASVSLRDPVLRACSQAGLVNNLNDALAWGLAPLYLAANGASVSEVGVVAAVYPAVWGGGQLAAGWLSDRTGRKPLIVIGMLVQGGALALLAAGGGSFGSALAAAVLLGLGTALVYPTLIAAVSDAVEPRDRAQAVGVYRFWRDSGLVAGGLLAGFVADAFGMAEAIAIVAGLTALSGLIVAVSPSPQPMRGIDNFRLDNG